MIFPCVPSHSCLIASDEIIQEVGTLWIHSVPQEIVNSVSETEKKRQEAINEVIYTERDFVRDLEYLRDVSPFFVVPFLLPFHIRHGCLVYKNPK